MTQQLDSKSDRQDLKENERDEIHFLDLLIVLIHHKKLVIGMPILVGLIAVVVSLLMTPAFKSTATFMPPQQQNSGVSAMLGQLGGLAGIAGGFTGIKNPGDLYVAIMGSRTMADTLIKRFDLQTRYESKLMVDARASLAGAREFSIGKSDGLISVTVQDKDPEFAAELANAFVEELMKLTQTMAISDASKRRLFFERQLKDVKEQLANAEIALRNTQQKTGMIQPEGQVQAIISSIAQIRGSIAAKEVQLNAMRTFAAEKNPDLLRTQEELRGLKAQLLKLEKSQPSKDGDFMVPSGKIPEIGVEYVRSLREVKYYETMFELLARQYELAKLDEAKDAPLIKVLDKAIPAERRFKPKRTMITLIGLIVGGMLGILLAFAVDAYQRARKNPANRNRWQDLKEKLKSF